LPNREFRLGYKKLKKHEETLFPYPNAGAAKVGSD
jgi:hypothetical protein